MAIIRHLPSEKEGFTSGIVEADEARQRESRKGSREWSCYRAYPANETRSPRAPWAFYKRRNASVKAPPGGWRAWDKNLMAITDRAGHRAFEAVESKDLEQVKLVLLPVKAPDSVLCAGSDDVTAP